MPDHHHFPADNRAERFGVEYQEPATTRRELKHASRKERYTRQGFATGIDLFDEEEISKRHQRASRFGMASEGLQWAPPQMAEDEEKKKQRAERFGVAYQPPDESGLMDVDLFEQRKDPGPEIERRLDALHIYGIDLLSTKDMLSYFKDYGPTYVEWLNDSSCNVTFKDDGTAKRALAGLGKPLSSEDATVPEGMDIHDPQNMIYLWHKGEDFKKSGSDIPIIFRMATALDVKPAERVQSRRLWQTAGGGTHKRRGRGGRRFNPYSGGGRRGRGAYSHGGEMMQMDMDDSMMMRGPLPKLDREQVSYADL